MMRPLLFAAALAVSAAPAFADLSTNPQSAPKGRYDIYGPHAVVMFCIAHYDGVSNFCGWFAKVSGTLQFNGSQPANGKIEAKIDLASAQTRSKELDDRLRDELFETAKFPTATFQSTSAKVTGQNQGEVTGNLTIHGTTKPVTLTVRYNGGKANPIGSGHVIGFSGEGKIKLSDFALPDVAWRAFIGNEVSLRIEAELINDQ